MLIEESEYHNILNDLISIVEKTKTQVAIQANSSLTIMFWQIGKRIQSDILENNRAEYGKEIVVSLSRHLSWSHFLVLIPLKTYKERYFYSKTVFENLISVRELRKQISKKVYQRTENADIQIHESKVIEKGIFKDPYLLDFLEIKNFLKPTIPRASHKGISLVSF